MERFAIEKNHGYLLARAHQYFSFCLKEKLNKYKITPPQLGMLAFLWKNDGINQIQLGSRMNKDRTTISGIIDRLEKEGLVIRRKNPDDRRTHLIYLTPRAFDLKDELERLAAQANNEATVMLTKAEKEQLEKILRKILDAAAVTRGYG